MNLDSHIETMRSKFALYNKNHRGVYSPMDSYIDHILAAKIEDLRFVLLASDFHKYLSIYENMDQTLSLVNTYQEIIRKDQEKGVGLFLAGDRNEESSELNSSMRNGIAILAAMTGLRVAGAAIQLGSAKKELNMLRGIIRKQVTEIDNIKGNNKYWIGVKRNLQDILERSWTDYMVRTPIVTAPIPTGTHFAVEDFKYGKHLRDFRGAVFGVTLAALVLPNLLFFGIKSRSEGLTANEVKGESWAMLLSGLMTVPMLTELYRQGLSYTNILSQYNNTRNILLDSHSDPLRKEAIGEYEKYLKNLKEPQRGKLLEELDEYKKLSGNNKNRTLEIKVSSDIADRYATIKGKPPAAYDSFARNLQTKSAGTLVIGHRTRYIATGTIISGIAAGITFVTMKAIITSSKSLTSKKGLNLVGPHPVMQLIEDIGHSASGLIQAKREFLKLYDSDNS